jgi:large subunit ribosomal protein L9
MEVILAEDIPSLGPRGKIVKVSDGYARNYLIPRKLALPATETNRKIIEQKFKQIMLKEAKDKKTAEMLAQQLSTISLTIPKKAGENDLLFGTVTSNEIAEELNKLNIEIDKRKIVLEEPIRRLGIYQIPIRLHKDVTATIKLWIIKEE